MSLMETNTTPAGGEPLSTPTVEDDIRAAIAELNNRDETFAPDAPEGEETSGEGRARDERGRFAPKADGEEPEATETNAGAPVQAEGSKPERLAPPHGWPADAKTQWDKLSRPVQEAISADLTAGKFRLGGDASAQSSDPIVSAARNFEGDARAAGADLADYVQNALGWNRHIAANPREGIRALAATLGVDLATLVPSAQAGVPGSHEASELAALRQELAELRTSHQRQRIGSVQSEVDAWAGEADTQGAPLRPHYAALDQTAFAHRVALVRQQNPGLANREVLQRAYDAEVYAQPTVRALVLDAERQKVEAQRKAEDGSRAAEAAKARSVSVRGTPSPAGKLADPVLNETPEDTVRRILAQSRI